MISHLCLRKWEASDYEIRRANMRTFASLAIIQIIAFL